MIFFRNNEIIYKQKQLLDSDPRHISPLLVISSL